MTNALRERLVGRIVDFGRALRAAGLDVSPSELQLLVRALERVDPLRRGEVKSAARSILVHRHRDLETFDRLFDRFWQRSDGGRGEELGRLAGRGQRATQRSLAHRPPAAAGLRTGRGRSRHAFEASTPTAGTEPGRSRSGEDSAAHGPPIHRATWSDHERLLRKDFAELTEEEREIVASLLGRRLLAIESRRSRRRRAARRGHELDLRRSLRRGLATGGELVHPARRRRRETPRPLVALLDVSGSMEPYLRVLLQFLYLVSRHGGVECFAFGTRLTRLTRPLADGDPDTALRRAAAAVVDWGGGTRIGEALETFNHQWGRRVLGGGAVVLVISDGWDRGEPELVAFELERLSLNTHRLLWLNPLTGLPGYRPATRALEAALPYVDEHLPVHDLASLERLAALLAGARQPSRSRVSGRGSRRRDLPASRWELETRDPGSEARDAWSRSNA